MSQPPKPGWKSPEQHPDYHQEYSNRDGELSDFLHDLNNGENRGLATTRPLSGIG
jgi:hypothetical protein